MTHQEAHETVLDYFFDHYSIMQPTCRQAFLVILLSMPLVPESWHPVVSQIAEDIINK